MNLSKYYPHISIAGISISSSSFVCFCLTLCIIIFVAYKYNQPIYKKIKINKKVDCVLNQNNKTNIKHDYPVQFENGYIEIICHKDNNIVEDHEITLGTASGPPLGGFDFDFDCDGLKNNPHKIFMNIRGHAKAKKFELKMSCPKV